VILYEVTTVLRNKPLRSSGYPADMDSMFSMRHSACVSHFIHVSALFILILYNIIVSTRQAAAFKLRGDGKFTANFEQVSNRKHVSVVYAVLLIILNYSEAPQLLQSAIQSGRGYQPITLLLSPTRGRGGLCCTILSYVPLQNTWKINMS
jgi:hypothetical protein